MKSSTKPIIPSNAVKRRERTLGLEQIIESTKTKN